MSSLGSCVSIPRFLSNTLSTLILSSPNDKKRKELQRDHSRIEEGTAYHCTRVAKPRIIVINSLFAAQILRLANRTAAKALPKWCLAAKTCQYMGIANKGTAGIEAQQGNTPLGSGHSGLGFVRKEWVDIASDTMSKQSILEKLCLLAASWYLI